MANAARASSYNQATTKMKKVSPARSKAPSAAAPQRRHSKTVYTPTQKLAVIPETRREARTMRKKKQPSAAQKKGSTAPQKRIQTTAKLSKVPQRSARQTARVSSVDKRALLANIPSINTNSSAKLRPVKRTQLAAQRGQNASAQPAKKQSYSDKPLTSRQTKRVEATQARKRMREERKQAKRAARTWKYFAFMGTTMAVLLVSLCLVYPVAKDYYQTVREQDKLQAEYNALVERNLLIQAEIDKLNTDEGVEDYARSELGWVKTGDNPVTVLNVGEISASTSLPKQVSVDALEIPNAWYNRLLDKVFSIE